MNAQAQNSDSIDDAIRDELPELVRDFRRWKLAASETTLSGQLRRAVISLRHPYEQTSRETGIELTALCKFMAGGVLPSDALDRLASVAHCELISR